MEAMRLIVDERDVAPVQMAVTARTRSKGLLGRTGLLGAIWLSPARQVHTFRMKFTIDVAHVGRDMRVVYVETMPPGRLGKWVWRSRGVIEAAGGSFAEWGLSEGSAVEFAAPDDSA
jgi:uncharacterized membrane protein (UPF0127 family)